MWDKSIKNYYKLIISLRKKDYSSKIYKFYF